MGCTKTTGNSHNKKSATYESKWSKPRKQLDWHRTLFDMLRKENVLMSSTVNNDEDQQITENETETQIDTLLDNMTDVSDESEESARLWWQFKWFWRRWTWNSNETITVT